MLITLIRLIRVFLVQFQLSTCKFWCGPDNIAYICGSLHYIFWACHWVWHIIVLSFHKGQSSYSFHRCIRLRLQSVYELNATACRAWWYPQNMGQNKFDFCPRLPHVWFLSETATTVLCLPLGLTKDWLLDSNFLVTETCLVNIYLKTFTVQSNIIQVVSNVLWPQRIYSH